MDTGLRVSLGLTWGFRHTSAGNTGLDGGEGWQTQGGAPEMGWAGQGEAVERETHRPGCCAHGAGCALHKGSLSQKSQNCAFK